MDKLNEYLKSLLSSCSDELRLEPDRNPYLIHDDRTTDIPGVPLAGTQISSMVFPIIPASVKSTLPSSNEVEFVHPHSLGNFNFNVQKSPAGFIVTIRPLFDASGARVQRPQPLPETPPANRPYLSEPVIEDISSPAASFQPEPAAKPEASAVSPSYVEPASAVPYEFESSSISYDLTAADAVATASEPEVIYDDSQPSNDAFSSNIEYPRVEVVSANDPEFQTVFSDTAAYEPPGRRDDILMNEYTPVAEPTPAPEFHQPQPEAYVPPPVTTPAPVAPSAPAFVPAAANSQQAARMDALFKTMADIGASDLHLSVSMPPMVRKDGKMRPMREADSTPLTAGAMRELLTSIMPAKNQEEFSVRNDTDFAYEIADLARFRCNVFMDRKGMGAVFRIIPTKILTAEQLGLSKAIMDLCALSKGLVVVTGPTGSGKSTTLCAMVDSINKNREDHIITIEDPIEFTHENQKCLVNQREVHNHTDSFKDALRAALREDPDILLVGEMRDLETISIAIETAETGHLVFGTLHTTTAASTVDRIIDQFPADRQQQIRVMLSESLKGVIAQTLLPKKGGGRVAALEILIVTPAISNLIREGKTFQIPSAMQTGKNHGMVMLNEALYKHVESGLVEPMDAYIKSVDKAGFETMLTRGGFKL
jgi:twitching motility protein PilT